MAPLRAALAPAAVVALAAPAAQAAQPSLYFHYAPDCSFTMVDDSGAALATVAPGTYQVVVDSPFPYSTNPASCKFVEFDLSGPGVSVATTLGDGGSTIDAYTVTLKPGSTYTAQDDNSPARTRKTFSTSTSGSAGSVTIQGTTTTATTTTTTATSTGSSAIGTSIPKTASLGTLAGTVSANGTLALTRNGKPVELLKAGRYLFSVVDRSRSAGFTVQTAHSPPIVVSSAGFVGKRSRTITLGRGQWLFYGSFVGRKTYFIVSAT